MKPKQTIHFRIINFLIILSAAVILNSCNSQNENNETGVQKQILKTISDPNEFVGDHKTKVMVLGLFHFHNPGLDAYKEKYNVDIFSEKRQQEINELIQKLRDFKPTKVLIEAKRIESDSILNLEYNSYLNDDFEITDKANEIYQIGFRLAKRLGHKKIYASDVVNSKWFGAELDWDNFNEDEYLKSLGQYDKATRYNFERKYELEDSLKSVLPLTKFLSLINDPSNRLKDHQAYLTAIIGGAGDLYISADGISRWYQRNLKIFANSYDIADFSKEERLLLIYGAGHVWQLRQLFLDSPDFEYIEVNRYLEK